MMVKDDGCMVNSSLAMVTDSDCMVVNGASEVQMSWKTKDENPRKEKGNWNAFAKNKAGAPGEESSNKGAIQLKVVAAGQALLKWRQSLIAEACRKCLPWRWRWRWSLPPFHEILWLVPWRWRFDHSAPRDVEVQPSAATASGWRCRCRLPGSHNGPQCPQPPAEVRSDRSRGQRRLRGLQGAHPTPVEAVNGGERLTSHDDVDVFGWRWCLWRW